MKIKTMGIAAAIIFCLSGYSYTAFAQLPVSITLKNPDPYNGNQSWFIYEKTPGEIIEDTASIKNYGSEPINIHICAVDGTTNTSGSFILKFDLEKQVGIGTWADIIKSDLTIKPGERIDIPFKITVPKNAQPGQYLGGIVIENQEFHMEHQAGNKISSSSEIKPDTSYGKAVVATRIGARIYLTIPGEVIEKAKVDSFEFVPAINNKSYFKFKISNTGNVAFAPTAAIKIFDQFGGLYDKIEKPLGKNGDLLSAPNTIIEPIVVWDKSPVLGRFTATAEVTFKRKFEPAGGLHGAPITSAASVKFMILPWMAIIICFLIFMIITTVVINKKHRVGAIIRTAKKYQVTSDDDLMSIARNQKIPWQLIAKINHIKAPYGIKPGQTIIIPAHKK
jgi:hypothetical protein